MTASTFKRLAIPTALVVGGVTAGSFLAPIGLASAAEDDTDSTDTGSDDAPGGRPDDDGGHRHGRHGGPRVEALEDVLGLTAEEIRDELEAGKTLAEVAEGQGISVEDLTDALVAAATERIDEAVAEGRLDADEAEERKADLEERIGEMVTRVPPEDLGERNGRRGPRGPLAGGIEVLEDVLGLSAEEIRAGLDEGKTLSEIAEEQGVPVDDMADALVAAATERIDEAVAEGRLDEDRAAQAKEHLGEMIDRAVEAEPFALGRGVGRADGRGLRSHHRNHHHGDDGGAPDDAGDVVDTGLSA
jgi:ribosomal protein S20